MRRTAMAVAVVAALAGLVASLGAADAAPAVGPAPSTADRIVGSISARLSTRSVDQLKAFGEGAMRLHGEERLRRLYFVGTEVAEAGLYRESDVWHTRVLQIARRERNTRYLRLEALIGMLDKAVVDPHSAPEELLKAFGKDDDWLVRAMAAGYAARFMAYDRRTRDALVALEEARAETPAGDPGAKITLSFLDKTKSYALLLIQDRQGGLAALADAEFADRDQSYPSLGLDTLRTLVIGGLALRDEDMVRRAHNLMQRVALPQDDPEIRTAEMSLCSRIESYFGTPERVLSCTDGADLSRFIDRVPVAQILVSRGIAYAKLGRTAEAKRDFALLQKQFRGGVNPASVPEARRLEGHIDALDGRAVEAVTALDDYWNTAAAKQRRDFQTTVPQLTDALQHDLDLARRNEQQQSTIILFQWVMGAVAALICAAAIAVLMWQRRLNARLVAANARAEAAQHRAEEANALKSQFLANVSHEVRPPLNGVLGMIQAIAADELSPVQRERLEVLRGSSRGMLAILNDLLDLAKIEAGKLTLESVEFDLAPVAEGSRHAFWAAAEAKGLALELMVEEDARGLYRGDPTRLRQIVDNLVSNAIKFTGEGGVFVTFAAMGAGEGLRLSVRDTGIGMTAEQAAKIFSKFEQAEASTTRKYGGTGLGLSICRELVQAFGGEITVSSAPGEGTVFMADLPLPRIGDSPDVGGADVPAEVAGLEDAGEGLRILAAEDHPVNQLVLRTLLSQLGCEVTMTGDGAQALEAFRTGRWDVVLMDIQMPVMDGIEAARAIRSLEREAGLARTSLVALTANAMPDQIAEYRAAGFDDHLSKPIDAQDLLTVLNRALAGYAEVPELAVA